MGSAPPINRNIAAGAALAALLSAVCYANILGNQFVFDDIEVIAHNPLVTSGSLDLRGIFTSHYWAHVTPAGNLYRPLTILSYWLNHAAGGLSPWGYHAVSILLHALCSALVVALASGLGLGSGAAMAAGALFAAHPIHTEAVAEAVGRADLLAAAAVLAALTLHVRGSGPASARAAAIAALFGAALLSKENGIVLPGLMLAADVTVDRGARRGWKEALPSYLSCVVVAAVWLALRAAALPAMAAAPAAGDPFTGVSAPIRVGLALDVLARYVWLLVWPVHLSADYSYAQIPAADTWLRLPTLAGAALLAALALIGLRGIWTKSRAAFCALFFIIAIAPVSNILIGIGTVMGERLIYLPSVGFCIALPALAATRVPRLTAARARRLALVVCVLLVCLYAGRTIIRNRDWKDQLMLFTVTARTSPRSAKVRYNFGRALEDAGRPQEALDSYEAALAILPDYAPAQNNAGLLLAASGRMEEARRHLEAATRQDPSLVTAWVSLGAARHALGDAGGAQAAFEAALRISPAHTDALYNLGALLLETGRFAEAAARLEEALRLEPAMTDARVALAECLLHLGELPGARAEAAAARAAGAQLPADLEQLLLQYDAHKP